METMTAFRLVGWQQAPRFVDVPIPTPASDELLVEVAAVGLCHTDLHFMHAPPGAYPYSLPFTLGHEIAGRVTECGETVGSFEVGQPVAIAAGPRCGNCVPCLRGEDNLCLSRTAGRGWGMDGGLAHYVTASAREAVHLTSLDLALAAPLSDAGVTSYHAVRRLAPRLRDGSTALVIGVGGLGGFAVQFLRELTPARIVVVDKSRARLAAALALGADNALGTDDTTSATIRDLTHGDGADAVLDFVGSSSTMELALRSARAGGGIAIAGAGGGTATIGWGLLPNNCELFIPMGGTTADLHDVVALAEAGRLRIEVDRYPFAEVADAYARLDVGTVTGRAVAILNS